MLHVGFPFTLSPVCTASYQKSFFFLVQYLSERPSTSILLAMQNSAQPKELYHEFSIITAQEILLDPKQKESLNPALTSETKDVHSEQEENQAVDAVKEPLLQ